MSLFIFLYSVVSLLQSDVGVGDDIELRLMRRERNSLFAVFVDDYIPEMDVKHPSVSSKLTSYSQLLTATPVEVANNIVARERKELEAQWRWEQLFFSLHDSSTIIYLLFSARRRTSQRPSTSRSP